MKLYLLSNKQFRKSMPSVVPDGIVVVDAEEVEAVEVVKAEVVKRQEVKRQVVKDQSTRVPSILIYQLVIGMGAACISDGAGEPTFVQNLQHVLGRMCSLQSPPNEVQTSSARHKLIH